MGYYVGVDLGKESMKLILCDSIGMILNTVSCSYPTNAIQPGWIEQSPTDWWHGFLLGIKELIEGFDANEIKCIGIGGQMCGLVLLDKYDSVIRAAILGEDERAFSEAELLEETIGRKKLMGITGNIALPRFIAPKLLWVKKHEEQNFQKISKIMLPKDYLASMLTGVHSTDCSDASGTLLFDINRRKWSDEILEVCGISGCQMPKLHESFEKIGTLLPEVAEELGLSEEISVVAGGGDVMLTALGAGNAGSSACNISLDSTGNVLIVCDKCACAENGELISYCYPGGNYSLVGEVLSASTCSRWFCRDILGKGKYNSEHKNITHEDMGNNHVFFLPNLSGSVNSAEEAESKGMFVGVNSDTARKDMVLAILEGVAFSIKDKIEEGRKRGAEIKKVTICGDGMKSKLWREILCNVLNIKLEIPSREEGAAIGAAMLAMTGGGEYTSIKKCSRTIAKTKRRKQVPDPNVAERYSEKYMQYKKLYTTGKEMYRVTIDK